MDTTTTQRPRRILWENVLTVVSAAILIAPRCSALRSPAAGRSPICWRSARSARAFSTGCSCCAASSSWCSSSARRNASSRSWPTEHSRRAPRRRRETSRPTIRSDQNACAARRNSLLAKSPNFARACGRVSVGGHPDKRPDSRLRKRRFFLAPATGSRRRTGNASSPLATRLKATTEGLFWMTAGANAGDTERACPSLPAVRNGISLIRTKAAITVTQSVRDRGSVRVTGGSPRRLRRQSD